MKNQLKRYISIFWVICFSVLLLPIQTFAGSDNKQKGGSALKISDNINIDCVKKESTYYTEEKIKAARDNISKYEWAKVIKENAVKEADKYLSYGGDEYWWSIVTPHTIPRAMGVLTRDLLPDGACPVCGKKLNSYGYYPWVLDPVNHPWKIKCPSCGYYFPTNDFESYYKSGLDEHGIFNKNKADPKYLVNTLYPEKGPKWGVDDGDGWTDSSGKSWKFIAYYNHFALWYEYVYGLIPKALNAFRDAYLYTGDVKYAHMGIILLDRIADVYPDMDIQEFPWDKGYDNGQPSWNICQGKILNETWEDFLIDDFAEAYDAFFPALKYNDSANVIPFLRKKSDQYKLGDLKKSITGIKKNIEDNILRQVFKAFKNCQMQGNFGMPQGALALTAIVLGDPAESKQMLDYDFKTGGQKRIDDPKSLYGRKYIVTGGDILDTLVNIVDRDGFGNEASPEYNNLWINQLKIAADVLDGYNDVYNLYNNVKFKKMFYSQYPLTCLNSKTPSIGDSGSCSDSGLMESLDNAVTAFIKFKDPVFAQLAYLINGNTSSGLHANIFTSDPENVQDSINDVIKEKGTLNLKSDNLTGYGFGILRDGSNDSIGTGILDKFTDLKVDNSSNEYKTLDSYNCILFKSAKMGDSITFDFDIPSNDNYDIALKTVTASVYGKYIIKIDGKQMKDEYDGYSSATNGNADMKVIGNIDLNKGKHTITFICSGKNSSASDYFIGLQQLNIRNKEVQEQMKKPVQPDTQRDLWIYYGRNDDHGHKDTLNIGLNAYGMDLSPDLGYPENMGEDPKRLQWVSNTISHNTVVVDASKQADQFVGIPHHFDDTDNVKMFDVEAPKVYKNTQMYRRTTAMIKVDDSDSYAVDFFRVKGGSDHHFSFHGNDGEVTTEGLNLVKQPTGTYAGPNIKYGQRYDSVDGTYYSGSGFHYLQNVERDNDPSKNFSVDWKMKQDKSVHLRLTMLGTYNDVALADGYPPANTSNPPSLKYVIAHRSGNDLNSLFTSVIEPYKNDRYISSISSPVIKLGDKTISNGDISAIKVVLKNGRTDYIINSTDKDNIYTIDNKIDFKGFFGVYTEEPNKKVHKYLNDGTVLSTKNNHTDYSKDSVNGVIENFTSELSSENSIKIIPSDMNFDVKQLIGKFIYVDNDGVRNASYRIKGIKTSDSKSVTLDIGDSTLIRGYVDSNDFSKGYIYDINHGQQFRIPLSYQIDNTDNKKELDSVDMAIDNNTISFVKGAKIALKGKMSDGSDADINNMDVSYESSNPELLNFDNDGNIKLLKFKKGINTVNVWAIIKYNGKIVKSNVCTVKINVLTDIKLSLVNTKLFLGDSVPIVLSGQFNDGTMADLSKADIKYIIETPNVINAVNGKIFAKAAGTANIYAEVELEGVKVSSNKISIDVVNSSDINKHNTNNNPDSTGRMPKTGYPIDNILMMILGMILLLNGVFLYKNKI